MEPILWELLNCVFMDFVGQEKRLRGEEPLKALYAMTTYFDKHREQTELYDDVRVATLQMYTRTRNARYIRLIPCT
jgi:hypothetical protein